METALRSPRKNVGGNMVGTKFSILNAGQLYLPYARNSAENIRPCGTYSWLDLHFVTIRYTGQVYGLYGA